MKIFMKFFITGTLVSLWVAFFYLAAPMVGFAQINSNPDPTFYSSGDSATLINPITTDDLCSLLKKMLDIILIFGVPIAVLFLTYSGFLFVKARGNPKELGRARQNFVYVILGIMLFLGAWTLGQIVASTISSLGVGSGAPGIGACSQ